MSSSERIEWGKEYETGIDDIDEQHMILVHTLNDIADKINYYNSVEMLEEVTQDLLSYALYHFETEETLMLGHGYHEKVPEEGETHLEQHRAFSKKVVDVREQLKQGTSIPAQDIIDFLNQWLNNHILKTDKKLGKFLSDSAIQ
ncbi:MAG: hemerythrin family protein [Gammaproteobacteria bacterium]|nr:hemerythrin family protein [Gammaproteobacteria bacterium]